jgi:hypothetical protein
LLTYFVIPFAIVAAVGATIIVSVILYSHPEQMSEVGYKRAATLPILLLGVFWLLRNYAELLKWRRRASVGNQWLSVWHPSDEAIAGLQSVERISLDFYARGALAKKIRLLTDGLILLLGALFITLAIFGDSISARGWTQSPKDLASTIWLILLIVIAIRIAARVIDPLVRGWANSRVRNLLRSIAFGQDHYVRLGRVSTRPWVYGGDELRIAGELSNRMQASAAEALARFVRNNQASLFVVGAPSAELSSAVPLERFTWKELVHTTYFDYDEISGAIAAHIDKLLSGGATAAAK